MRFKRYCFLLLFCGAIQSLHAQLVFDTLSRVEQMVKNAFQSEGVEISRVMYRGSKKCIQTFHNDSNQLPIQAGIFLGTGHYLLARGPNFNSGSSYTTESGSDPFLTALAGYLTYDAAILEFDFVPTGNTVSFRYLFASEEYPEYVGSKFNDVFAFYISGPGIKGMKNMALVPGSHKPVTINNINHLKNKQYFIDNAYQVYNPFTSTLDSTGLEYDGFTTLLEAKAKVIAGQTYHLRISIADVKDKNYDSGVFLESGSFKSENTETSNQPAQPKKTERNHEGNQKRYLSTRTLSVDPPDHILQIIFEDSVVESFQNSPAFIHRLEQLLPVFYNYPEALIELNLGVSTAQKNAFADFLINFLEAHEVSRVRIQIIKNTLPASQKKKKEKPDKTSQRVLLILKQKSRHSDE